MAKTVKVGFISLGCSKNLCDTEVMLKHLLDAGYDITPEETEADVVIVNTCAFIEAAKKEAIDNILDIALKYGYNSHEVFSRAFTRIWGETPSQYRKNRTFSEIYPKLDIPITNSGGHTMKKFDLTGLYETLREMDGTYAICFDMCNLLIFNEKYGHNAGDAMLKHVSGLISGNSRICDGVYRWGGEEFIVILPDTGLVAAAEMAERVRSVVEESVCEFEDLKIKATMSFGVTQIDKTLSIEDNVKVADERLYRAKEGGRNRVIMD